MLLAAVYRLCRLDRSGNVGNSLALHHYSFIGIGHAENFHSFLTDLVYVELVYRVWHLEDFHLECINFQMLG